MADPVKTQLLKAIEAALRAITVDEGLLFATVMRFPSNPPDRETAVYPIAFIFDQDAPPQRRNRIFTVTMPIQIHAWIQEHELTISDQADIIEAEVHKALLADTLIMTTAMDFKPDDNNGPKKFIDDEFLGGIILFYIAKFGYAYDDPYNAVRT